MALHYIFNRKTQHFWPILVNLTHNTKTKHKDKKKNSKYEVYEQFCHYLVPFTLGLPTKQNSKFIIILVSFHSCCNLNCFNRRVNFYTDQWRAYASETAECWFSLWYESFHGIKVADSVSGKWVKDKCNYFSLTYLFLKLEIYFFSSYVSLVFLDLPSLIIDSILFLTVTAVKNTLKIVNLWSRWKSQD